MMNKLFRYGGRFYGFRWFFIIVIVLMATMVYADVSGWRIFGGGNQQTWSAGGPGYHK